MIIFSSLYVILQVSRRLARRLYTDVKRKNWAYVRITVTAYMQLLQSNDGQHARVYATELVVRTAVSTCCVY